MKVGVSNDVSSVGSGSPSTSARSEESSAESAFLASIREIPEGIVRTVQKKEGIQRRKRTRGEALVFTLKKWFKKKCSSSKKEINKEGEIKEK